MLLLMKFKPSKRSNYKNIKTVENDYNFKLVGPYLVKKLKLLKRYDEQNVYLIIMSNI